jgi:flagellar basal-body rod modification protein FlgD
MCSRDTDRKDDSMTIQPTAHAASAAQTRSGSEASGGEESGGTNGILGQNDFLKLMIAQLQAQNPLEPGNSNEVLDQLAQLTQVEQTTNLANANELSGAVQMIGRSVTYNSGSGESLTGTVESVQSNASGVTVTVGEQAGVTLASITNVQ